MTFRLDFDSPPADPVPVFETWFREAQALALPNPNAMYLATIDVDGRPSVRTVLLKGLDVRGAVFFTNRRSRKGLGLEAHGRAALLFHWDMLDRQVRIDGTVAHTTDAESDAYFASRPRISQINAWASEQSMPVASRQALDERVIEVDRRFAGGPVPRPQHWGGYRVALDSIEFWQGDPFRLHDRVRYMRQDDGTFVVQRLCP